MTFLTSAGATKTSIKRTRRPRLPNAFRADKLIRNFREGLEQQSTAEAGQAPARVYGYGLALVETTRVFRQITNDGRLHVVDVISGDEIDGILAYLVEDALVFPGDFPGQIRPDGEIFSGRFKNNGSKIFFRNGAAGQTAISELVSKTAADNTFVGTGLAYVYSIWKFIEGRFDGDPTISVIARMRQAVDPRGTPTRWSFNPYVQLFDLLTKSPTIGGAGIATSRVDTASFSTGADWADMLLDSPGQTKTALFTTETNTGSSNHVLEFNEAVVPFQYGDVVQVVASAGQVLPPNYSPGVDYHVIVVRHRFGDFQVPGIALATSLENALDGTFITAGFRTTDIDIKKVKETRYMSGFSYEARQLGSTVSKLLESCGASFYLNDGKIAVTRQSFPATVETVTEDQLFDQFSINNKIPASERATTLTGSFTSLLNLLEPDDYPLQDGDGIYATLDGRDSPQRLELPFVGKVNVAQRLASIALRRLRQEKSIAFSGGLNLYRLTPNTVFTVDKPSLGLDSNTPFEVVDQTVFVDIDNDTPSLGVDIVARQLESDTFDLDVSAEQLVEAARIPGLDSPFEVAQPGDLTITESLFNTTTGAGVKARATISWTAATGGFIRGYLVSYKLTAETTFRRLAEVPSDDTSLPIDDIEPGTYDFRVQSVNSIGLQSDPLDKVQDILALSAPPSDPANLLGQVVGSGSVVLTWDESVDLDVRFGGKVEIRHQSDPDGGLGGDSILLGTQDGNSALAQVPFKRGTYYIRFIDQSGNASGFAEFSADTRRPVPFAQAINAGVFDPNNSTEDAITIQEDPTFPSTNPSNTLFEDTGNQRLELAATGGWDDISDLDAVADIDAIGSSSGIEPEGVYFLSSGVSLNAVTRMLVETVLETAVVDESTSIDTIENWDDIENLDSVGANASQPGQADAYFEARSTRDDPTGSPTWGPWQRLDTDIFNHRGLEFRVQGRSFASTVNIRITKVQVLVRELPVDF